MSTWEFYERKISNEDMPFQLQIEQRNETGLYVWPHWHEEMEILYVTEGSARVILEQQEYLVEKGNIIIINANELHSAYCETIPYTGKVIVLNLKNIIKNTPLQDSLLKPMVTQDDKAISYIEQIFTEFTEQSYGYIDSCKAILTLLIIYLNRNYISRIDSDKTMQKRIRNLARLTNVLSYIDQHYTEQISNKQLADMMFLSENRFSHLFRKSVGIPPQHYINILRLQKAKELILSTNHTITEIARIVGFQDYNHFGRQFLKYHGYTPRELKKQGIPPKNAS